MIYKNRGREAVTVDATAGGVALTATKYSSGEKATYAQIQVQTAPIRVTEDGTAPVGATTGLLFNIGDIFEVWGYEAISKLRMIRDGSVSAVAEVNYYG